MRPELQHLPLCHEIHVLVAVESVGSHCPRAGLRVNVVLELFFGEDFHSAAGVADDHDLAHAQNVN